MSRDTLIFLDRAEVLEERVVALVKGGPEYIDMMDRLPVAEATLPAGFEFFGMVVAQWLMPAEKSA